MEKLWTRSRYSNNWVANMKKVNTKEKMAYMARDLGRRSVLLEEAVKELLECSFAPSRSRIKEKYNREFRNAGLEVPDVFKCY